MSCLNPAHDPNNVGMHPDVLPTERPAVGAEKSSPRPDPRSTTQRRVSTTEQLQAAPPFKPATDGLQVHDGNGWVSLDRIDPDALAQLVESLGPRKRRRASVLIAWRRFRFAIAGESAAAATGTA